MDGLINRFNEMPIEAQYVIMGAGVLIGILILVAIIIVVISIARSGKKKNTVEKVKIPRQLPIAPVPVLNNREHALYRVLATAIANFPGYDVYAKVSTSAMLGPREEEHEKVAKAIMAKLVHDAHDFVIVDRSRIPVAVVELDSNEEDLREEQARRAGLPIIRVKNPRVSSQDMTQRLKGILK